MTTMTVCIENNADANYVATMVSKINGVSKVKMQTKQKLERIPGLAYTQEERVADIRKAEEDYAMGKVITSEELGKRIATW